MVVVAVPDVPFDEPVDVEVDDPAAADPDPPADPDEALEAALDDEPAPLDVDAEGIVPRLTPDWGWKRRTPATPATVPATTNGARRIRTRTPRGGCGAAAHRGRRPRTGRRG